MAYASVWRRLGACGVDAALVAGSVFAAARLVDGGLSAKVAAAALAGVAAEGGMAAFESLRRGTTPGKRVFGIRVVNDDGACLGLRAAALRNAVKWAPLNLVGVLVAASQLPSTADLAGLQPTLLIAAYGLTASSLFALSLGHDRQSLHDSVAGSIVILRRVPAGPGIVTVEKLLSTGSPPGVDGDR